MSRRGRLVPGLRQIVEALTTPVRALGDAVVRRADDIRRQAPGARMIGEFAVRTGLREVGKRFGGQPSTPPTGDGDPQP
ncbi:MAG: hypothetical protein RJA51_1580 [Actinomycetota bacterium]|jgi:hypothetical protein